MKIIDDLDSEPLQMEEVKKQKLFIATPCYGGMVFQEWVSSTLGLLYTTLTNGIGCQIILVGNESLVPRARNHLVAGFMASDCTHLMFIDADIQYNPQDVIRLLALNKNVITGAYPKKQDDCQYVINLQDEAKADSAQKIVEVKDAGTGFMMIKREVFTDMFENHPELHYETDYEGTGFAHIFGEKITDPETVSKLKKNLFSLFDTMHEPEDKNRYLSEDYTFCRRYQRLGGRIWLDTTIPLNHIGKKIFKGDISQIFKDVIKI
jgi:hypothetical protein